MGTVASRMHTDMIEYFNLWRIPEARAGLCCLLHVPSCARGIHALITENESELSGYGEPIPKQPSAGVRSFGGAW